MVATLVYPINRFLSRNKALVVAWLAATVLCMCCHSLLNSVISNSRKTNTVVRVQYTLVLQAKVMVVLPLFLFRHAGVHFTGRPPCFTQRVVRGRALSLFTPLLRRGGSKAQPTFYLPKSDKYDIVISVPNHPPPTPPHPMQDAAQLPR